MHAEVFGTKEFQDWAKKNVVLLTVDFPHEKKQTDEVKKQNQQLMQKYKKDVEGYPTILFLDAKGEVLGKSGYLPGGPEKWTKEADKVVAKAKRCAARPRTERESMAPPADPSVGGARFP